MFNDLEKMESGALWGKWVSRHLLDSTHEEKSEIGFFLPRATQTNEIDRTQVDWVTVDGMIHPQSIEAPYQYQLLDLSNIPTSLQSLAKNMHEWRCQEISLQQAQSTTCQQLKEEAKQWLSPNPFSLIHSVQEQLKEYAIPTEIERDELYLTCGDYLTVLKGNRPQVELLFSPANESDELANIEIDWLADDINCVLPYLCHYLQQIWRRPELPQPRLNFTFYDVESSAESENYFTSLLFNLTELMAEL